MNEDITIENNITIEVLNENAYQWLTVNGCLRLHTRKAITISVNGTSLQNTLSLIYPSSVAAINSNVTVNDVLYERELILQTPNSFLTIRHNCPNVRVRLNVILLVADTELRSDVDAFAVPLHLESSTIRCLESFMWSSVNMDIT